MKKQKLIKVTASMDLPVGLVGTAVPAGYNGEMAIIFEGKDLGLYGFNGSSWSLIHRYQNGDNHYLYSGGMERYYVMSFTGQEEVAKLSFFSAAEISSSIPRNSSIVENSKLQDVNEIPPYTAGDENKMLTVLSDGSLAWLLANESYVVDGGEVVAPSGPTTFVPSSLTYVWKLTPSISTQETDNWDLIPVVAEGVKTGAYYNVSGTNKIFLNQGNFIWLSTNKDPSFTVVSTKESWALENLETFEIKMKLGALNPATYDVGALGLAVKNGYIAGGNFSLGGKCNWYFQIGSNYLFDQFSSGAVTKSLTPGYTRKGGVFSFKITRVPGTQNGIVTTWYHGDNSTTLEEPILIHEFISLFDMKQEVCIANYIGAVDSSFEIVSITTEDKTSQFVPVPLSPTLFGDASVVDGVYSFDGTGDYATFGDKYNFRDKLTVSCWFKRTGNCTLFSTEKGGQTSGYSLSFTSGTAISIKTPQGGAVTATDVINTADGQWHHVALIWDLLNEFKFYLDGNMVYNLVQTNNVSIYINGAELYLGSSSTPNNYLNGQIAGLSVLNQALTEAEVLQLRDTSAPSEMFLGPLSGFETLSTNTLSGGATVSEGTGLSLASAGDYSTGNSNLNIGSTLTESVSVWFKATSLNSVSANTDLAWDSGHCVVGNRDFNVSSRSNGFEILVANNSLLTRGPHRTNTTVYLSNNFVTDQWYKIDVTWTATAFKTYINGVLVSTATVGNTAQVGQKNIEYGYSSNIPGRQFYGNIIGFQSEKRTKTDAEILESYNQELSLL